MDPARYRASDADRERVAERLRVALEEGRLNLTEYDERLRDAFAARTYAELDGLLADLPGTVPPSRSQVVPASERAAGRRQPDTDGRYPGATRRWLVQQWDGWTSVIAVCTAIWAVTCVLSGHWQYYWPGWVAGPWGALVLLGTIRGLAAGEPQRRAAEQARKDAEREVRRRASEGEAESTGSQPSDSDDGR